MSDYFDEYHYRNLARSANSNIDSATSEIDGITKIGGESSDIAITIGKRRANDALSTLTQQTIDTLMICSLAVKTVIDSEKESITSEATQKDAQAKAVHDAEVAAAKKKNDESNDEKEV